jgi:fatty acid desaturase
MLDSIKSFYNTYGYFHVRAWTVQCLAMVALVVLPIEYFAYSLMIYVFMMPLVQLISHEYVCHEYVTPKNTLINWVVLIIFYGLAGRSVTAKRSYHVSHHRYWKDPEKDPPQQKMAAGTFWGYVLNTQRPVAQNIDLVTSLTLDQNPIVKLLDPIANRVYWIFHITLFLLLPVEWFVVILIYVQVLMSLLFNVHDYMYHGPKYRATDHSYYLPLFGNQAWHIKHHEYNKTNYFGPGLWKYINPSWHYTKLLFNDTNKSLS